MFEKVLESEKDLLKAFLETFNQKGFHESSNKLQFMEAFREIVDKGFFDTSCLIGKNNIGQFEIDSWIDNSDEPNKKDRIIIIDQIRISIPVQIKELDKRIILITNP